MNTQKILKQLEFTPGKKDYIKDFYKFDIDVWIKMQEEMGEDWWQKQGEKRALKLFHSVAERVPAYKDWLKKYKLDHKKIKTIQDFKSVPVMDKKNYILKYPVEKLNWDGKMENAEMISLSSGTSGKPCFWPRGSYQEFESAIIHEAMLKNFFEIDKKRTLMIVNFIMGTHLGGLITTNSGQCIASKGYALNIVSPGLKNVEALSIWKQFAKKYEQVIIVGYPPFLKDLIDEGVEQKIGWQKSKIKFLFSGDGFGEDWREYVHKNSGIGQGSYGGSINLYASSDAGVMAQETLLTTCLLKKFDKNINSRESFFGNRDLPYLFQYNPFLRYYETVGDELVFSSFSGLPLIRYNIQDRGQVLNFEEAMKNTDDKLKTETQKLNKKFKHWKLPFLCLYGRKMNSVVFYAGIIYVDEFRAALDDSHLSKYITGKFVVRRIFDKNQSSILELNIELNLNTKSPKNLSKVIQKIVIDSLVKTNVEYRAIRNDRGKKADPRIHLYPYKHEKYFNKPGKHQWLG